jgi:hypothetical protein
MITKDLVKSLNRLGIASDSYRRPPIGKDVFTISIQPRPKENKAGIVTVNQGKARVEVFGSKAKKQAVVLVREEGRRVTRSVRTTLPYSRHSAKPEREELQSALRSKFNVIMPSEAVWSFADIKIERKKGGGDFRPWIVTGKVTARVNKRTYNNLLIGMDETHHFIAPLPKKAISVREAHRLLRPDVKKSSIRTGEWFFEPCDTKTCAMVDKAAQEKLPRTIKRSRGHGYRLGNTTHYAAVLVTAGTKKQQFARGDIIDGRDGHHALVFLPKWHRVVRNKEGTIKVHKDQRERLQRARQTWD